jgi:DNA-binding response OmpR family regulator
MLDLICLHLQQGGCEASGYTDSMEGDRAMPAERPTLLVLDIGMPYLDGLELPGAMRADANTADIPTIILMSRTDARAEQEARDAGATRYLTKPLPRQMLLDAVAAVPGQRSPSLRAELPGLAPVRPDYRVAACAAGCPVACPEGAVAG